MALHTPSGQGWGAEGAPTNHDSMVCHADAAVFSILFQVLWSDAVNEGCAGAELAGMPLVGWKPLLSLASVPLSEIPFEAAGESSVAAWDAGVEGARLEALESVSDGTGAALSAAGTVDGAAMSPILCVACGSTACDATDGFVSSKAAPTSSEPDGEPCNAGCSTGFVAAIVSAPPFALDAPPSIML